MKQEQSNITSRERYAHKIMFTYQDNKELVQNFMSKAYRYTYKMSDEPMVQKTFKSDPTARGGILLADPPEYIRDAVLKTEAVEAAWQEVKELDCGEPFGLAYLMEKNFCLTGNRRSKSANAVVRHKICSDCGIADRTFYSWMGQITDIMIYHATKRGLM